MSSIRPGRTVVAAVSGSIVGGLSFAYITQIAIVPTLPEGTSGLGEALVVLQGLQAGMIVGSAFALAVAFHDEPSRARLITAGVWLLPSALVFIGALQGLVEPLLVAPYVLLPASVVLALLGRVIAARTGDGHAAS